MVRSQGPSVAASGHQGFHANPPLPSGHPFVIVNSEYWSDTPVAQGNPGDVWTFVLDRGRTFSGSIDGTIDYVWCVR